MSSRSSLLVAVIALALLGSVGTSRALAAQAGRHHVQVVSLTIAAGDRVAEPNVAVAPGLPVRLVIHNDTREFHTFTIPRLGLSALIRPAAAHGPRTTVITFTPLATGAFVWRCLICPSGQHGAGHAMDGTLYAIIDPRAVP